MKRFKKVISIVLCLMMVLSSIPTTAFATLHSDAAGKAKLQLVLLRAATEEDEAATGYDGSGYVPLSEDEIAALTKSADGTTFTDNNKFFVGFKAVNFNNISQFHNADDAAKSLVNYSYTIEYDTNYLIAEPSFTNASWRGSATRINNAIKGRLTDANSFINKYNDAELNYSYTYGNGSNLVKNSSSANLKKAILNITYSGTNDGEVTGYTMDSEEYLAILEFGIVDTPGVAGADAMHFAITESSDTAMRIGLNSNSQGFSYRCYANPTEDEQTAVDNIETVIEYDDAAAKLIFPHTYTLAFDVNAGGAETTPATVDSVQLKEGYAIGNKLPAGPTRNDGKVFVGWYDDADAGNKMDATSSITDDTTWYAHWADGYGVTFDANGGAWADSDTTKMAIGETGNQIDITALTSNPTKTVGEKAYEFKGWAADPYGAAPVYNDYAAVKAAVTDTTTVYAKWEVSDDDLADAVIVTLNPNGGKIGESTDNKTVTLLLGDTLGTAYPAAADMTKDKYVFNDEDSWNTKQNGTDTAVKADTAITASLATAVDPAPTDAPKYELTLFAQWTADPANPDNRTVTFDKNGGDTEADPTTLLVADGTAIGAGNEPNAPTRAGYSFAFWTEDATAETPVAYDFDTAVTGDMTLYAVWNRKIDITFNANGGSFTGETPKLENVTVGDTLKAADLVGATTAVNAPANYKFKEWNTLANGSGTIAADGVAITADMTTLFAIYEPDVPDSDKVTVTFDKNGGTTDATPSSITIVKDTKIGDVVGMPGDPATPDAAGNPTREGYTFTGWYDAPIGGAVVDDNTTVSEDMTAYAHWVSESDDPADYWTVTFHKNDGTTGNDEVLGTVQINKADTPCELNLSGYVTAEREGYDALRWENADKSIYVKVAEDADTVMTGQTVPDTVTEKDGFKNIAITGDTDFFMVWSVDPTVTLTAAEMTGQTYNGQPHAVTVDTVVGNDGTTAITLTNAQVSYQLGEAEPATDAPVAAGTYKLEVAYGAQDGDHPVEVGNAIINGDSQLTIAQLGLTLKLADGKLQEQEANNETTEHTLTFVIDTDAVADDLKAEVNALTIANTYYEFVAAEGETAEHWNEMTGDNSVPQKYNKYAVHPAISGDGAANYIIAYADGIEKYTAEELNGKLPNDLTDDGLYAKLIVKSAVSLSGIAIKEGKTGEEPTDVDLFDDKTKVGNTDDKVTFDPETGEYFAQIKPGNEVTITLTGTLPTGTATVTLNGDPNTTVTDNGDGTYTVTGTLTEADPTKGNDGFDNKLVVSWGEDPNKTEYTVNIRQLLEAKIELAPGNSPYGLIERMGLKTEGAWDADKIAQAKTEFAKGNTFVDGFVPDLGKTGVNYTLTAWYGESLNGIDPDDITINMDRNPNALFVYNKRAFVEPGFEAINSDGTAVNASDVTVKVTVNRMDSNNYASMKNTTEDPDIVLTETDGQIESLVSGLHIAPGIYTMTYSFTDSVTGQVVNKTRNLVVVWGNGDADMNDSTNTTDPDMVSDIVAGKIDPYDGLDSIVENIYKFRIVDADNNGAVNTTDPDMVSDIVAGKVNDVVYYTNLEK